MLLNKYIYLLKNLTCDETNAPLGFIAFRTKLTKGLASSKSFMARDVRTAYDVASTDNELSFTFSSSPTFQCSSSPSLKEQHNIIYNLITTLTCFVSLKNTFMNGQVISSFQDFEDFVTFGKSQGVGSKVERIRILIEISLQGDLYNVLHWFLGHWFH